MGPGPVQSIACRRLPPVRADTRDDQASWVMVVLAFRKALMENSLGARVWFYKQRERAAWLLDARARALA